MKNKLALQTVHTPSRLSKNLKYREFIVQVQGSTSGCSLLDIPGGGGELKKGEHGTHALL